MSTRTILTDVETQIGGDLFIATAAGMEFEADDHRCAQRVAIRQNDECLRLRDSAFQRGCTRARGAARTIRIAPIIMEDRRTGLRKHCIETSAVGENARLRDRVRMSTCWQLSPAGVAASRIRRNVCHCFESRDRGGSPKAAGPHLHLNYLFRMATLLRPAAGAGVHAERAGRPSIWMKPLASFWS